MANLKDFATGTVLTAPTPATSGLTLTLQSGEGARMPAVPFYATAHPDYQLPTLDNAEKILVTGKSTDTLTFVRAQGSTTAKSIAVGWRISNAVFADDLFNSTIVPNETPSGTINGVNVDFTVAAGFNAGTLCVYLNGQRLKSGSGNDYVETANLRGFTMQYAPATGDVLLVDYIVGTSVIMNGVNVRVQEAPAGSVNGSNASFTTAKGYVSGTLQVYVNGLLQAPTTHVTEVSPSAGTFTLDSAPLTGDIVRVIYDYALSTGGNAAALNGIAGSDVGGVNGFLIADYYGWQKFPVALTYASATTFTAPGDITGWIQKGDKIWLTQTTSKYFYVLSTSFSSGVTTVTVTAGTSFTLANAAITAPYFSKVHNPQGFPHWFTMAAPTWGNVTSVTVRDFRFRISDSTFFVHFSATGTKSGAHNYVNFTSPSWPAPVNSGERSTLGRVYIYSVGAGIDDTGTLSLISGVYYMIIKNSIANGQTVGDFTLDGSWEI